MYTIVQIKFLDEELRGIRHGRVTRGCALFSSEVNSIRDNLGGTASGMAVYHVVCARHDLKHRRVACAVSNSFMIFKNYEKLRGMHHARVTCGGSCTTKLNCKHQHPNVGIRLWQKHKSCRKHLKVFRCQIWRCSDIV